MTIRTALLDARLILGDEALFAEFQHRFREDVLEGERAAFIEAKLDEQNARHARAGASRYLVEPNIKDGKGGLRDLHTLHWLAKHLYPDKAEAEFVEAGVFTPARISQLPPLRELPLDGALPAAFPHRAARGALELRSCSR